MSKHIEKLVILLMLSIPAFANDPCIDKLHMLIREKTNMFLMVRDTMHDVHEFWDKHKYPRSVFISRIESIEPDDNITEAAHQIYSAYLLFSNPADVMERVHVEPELFDKGFFLLRRAIHGD